MLLSILWNNVTQVFYSAGRKSASAIPANQRFDVNPFLYAVSVLTKVFKVTGSNFWINKSIKSVRNVFFFFFREKITSLKDLSTPYFPMETLKQFVMEAIDDAVRKGARPNRDPIGGSNANLFVWVLHVEHLCFWFLFNVSFIRFGSSKKWTVITNELLVTGYDQITPD